MNSPHQKGKLVIISAPSGSGKTTIAHQLLNSDLKLKFSVSACSREKRPGEIEGIDYYFISQLEFRDYIDAGEFLEWEEVYPDHYYGTLKREVKRIAESGHNVLFDVDVVGGLNIKKQYGDFALAIFIKPPSIKELEKRLKKRSTDSIQKIQMRLDKARQEISLADDFDLIIINDDLDLALEKTSQAIREFLMINNTNSET